jgi:hypothetical protein
MTNDHSDIFDSALSADALRKAANEGEVAAQTLLILIQGRPVNKLTKLVKAATQVDGAQLAFDAEGMRAIRRNVAHTLSRVSLASPSKKIRKTARRFLNSPEASNIGNPAGAITRAGFLRKEGMTLLDIGEKIARKVLISVPGAELAPTWFLERAGEDIVLVFKTPWSNDEAKAEILDQMREIMRKEGVARYVLAAESWVSTDLMSTVRPRDSDTRIEIVSAVTSEGEGKFWTIVRDGAGVVTELEPFLTECGIDGRMTNLLDHAPDGPPLKFGDGPLTLLFLGRVTVVSPNREVIIFLGHR